MLKNNKGKLIASSLLILLPIPVGLLLWDRLPEQFATHWGLDGQVDGWSGKPLAIFLLPVVLLVFHWVCVLITAADPGNKNQSRKAFGIVLWIVPVLSMLSTGIIYAVALGMQVNPATFLPIVLGLMFIILGNYMPKYRQNRTLGIKIAWTLHSEENWNATHRFAGWVWTIGGLVMMPCAFLPGMAGIIALLIVLVALVLLPVLYSYRYYRAQRKAGLPPVKSSPAAKWGPLVGPVILALALWFAGTGRIQTDFRETALHIETDRWEDLTVEYAVIDRVEYRQEKVSGHRTNGFGGFRVMLGLFENEEFGAYTRYTYNSSQDCVVIVAGERVLVLSGKDEASTRQIYDELLRRMED